MEPRSAGAMGAEFPYTLQTMCYVEVHGDGAVTHGRDAATYERAMAGQSRLFAVWPGQWRSDLFAIDNLDEYAKAFGILHDEQRTGLADHEHEVRWAINSFEKKPQGSYITIDVELTCGCRIRDLRTFASQMQQQKGWNIATSGGWGYHGSDEHGWTYSIRVRRKSLKGQ